MNDVFAPLARSSAPVVTQLDSRRFIVDLPTIRDAVELSAAAPGLLVGDADDAAIVDVVLARWLEPDLHEILSDMEVEDLVLFIGTMLRAGTDVSNVAKHREDDGGESNAQPDPYMLLADYCDVYGGAVAEVYLTTPWPLFIQLLARMDAANARSLLRRVELEILPHSGKAAKGTLSSLTRRARSTAAAAEAELYAPPEIIQRDRARLREMLGGGPVESEDA